VTAPTSQTRRYVAWGRGGAHHQHSTPLSPASGGSGRACAGYSGPTAPAQRGGEDVLPPAAHRGPVRTQGAPHCSAHKRGSGHTSTPTGRGAPSTAPSQRPGGALSSARSATSAAQAERQGPRTRAAVSVRLRAHRAALPPTTAAPFSSCDGRQERGQRFQVWREVTAVAPAAYASIRGQRCTRRLGHAGKHINLTTQGRRDQRPCQTCPQRRHLRHPIVHRSDSAACH
jgi:hypothetical protein